MQSFIRTHRYADYTAEIVNALMPTRDCEELGSGELDKLGQTLDKHSKNHWEIPSSSRDLNWHRNLKNVITPNTRPFCCGLKF